MQIGRTNFNVEALKDLSEDEFKSRFKGTLNSDINEAWKEFKKEARKFKGDEKPKRTTKKKPSNN